MFLLARLYLRGWFTVDLVSILPFDSIGCVIQSDDIKLIRVIRVIRLLRALGCFTTKLCSPPLRAPGFNRGVVSDHFFQIVLTVSVQIVYTKMFCDLLNSI